MHQHKLVGKQHRKARLDSLRTIHANNRPQLNKQSPVIKPDSKAFDFKSHSAYSEVRIAKAASQTLGVKSPFFRKADAVTSTKLKIEGKWVSNFASYDYLSLNLSEPIQQAVDEAVGQWGVSSTASRLVGGERELHARLEARIAEFVGTESALVMVSGHATNMALVRTLAGQGDLILVDALAHNSIYEGIRASGAQHATFPHNDFGWIDRHLSGCRRDYKNVLIIVEGLYSMDGDAPDLASFLDVKQRNDAWLMVDEAHSMGVLGKTGRGICEEQNVQVTDVEIIMGTLSKSFCSCGGFIAGSDSLIDLMRYKAQGFVYSVGLSAPNTAAALAAIDIIDEHPEYVTALTKVGEHFKATAQRLGLDTGESQGHAICPIIIGDSLKAVWIANRLLEDGFNVLPIIAPAVPDKSARLRFFLNRDHDEACVEKVLRKTASLHKQSLNMAVTDLASG